MVAPDQAKVAEIAEGLSEAERKAFLVLSSSPIRAREFAEKMWPDSKGWQRPGRCGHGSHRGMGMYIAGGCHLGRLRRKFPDLMREKFEGGTYLTPLGLAVRQYLKERQS